jgi:hypothetical protein
MAPSFLFPKAAARSTAVSKKKDSLAFYELISREKAKGGLQMTIPAWMAGGKKPPAPAPAEPSPPASPPPPAPAAPAKVRPAVSAVERPAVSAVERPAVSAVERPAVSAVERPAVSVVERPVAPPRPPKAVKAPAPRPPEKIVATEGKMLKLSITTTHAVAAGVVLLILIAGMFVLGRVARFSSSSRSSPPAAKSPAAAVGTAAPDRAHRPTVPERRETPKSPPKPAERKEEPAGNKSPADNAAKLEKGKYYLVVQGLMGMDSHHRVEAEAIANFLNSNGEPVTVMTYKGTPQQYIVLSQRGFDSPDSPEAKKYMQAIEEQGKLYKSQGGKYDFNQGPSGWFVKM